MKPIGIFLLLTCMFLLVSSFKQENQALTWQNLEEGLDYCEFKASQKPFLGDGLIDVLRINPKYFTINLFSAKEASIGKTAIARDWASQQKQMAVFNARMYLDDYETNKGYMKDFDFVNNPNINSDNAILAFNPINKELPPVQIIDRKCQDWSTLIKQYQSCTQSIRMVDCNQRNCWSKQAKRWSMLVTAIDKSGNLLFIFCRSPYTVHDFIDMLLASPLNIYNMMYLEGGPEVSFYLNHPKKIVAKMGSYETDFVENDDNHGFWEIPNIIGIARK